MQKGKGFATRIAAWLESTRADMRFGQRQLAKAPMITVAVVVSLLVVIQWTNADGFPGFIRTMRGATSNAPGGGMVGSPVSVAVHRALGRESSGFESGDVGWVGPDRGGVLA